MGQRLQEWCRRIELWLEEMPEQFYEELEAVDFEACFTKDMLTFENAMKQSFIPMPQGTKWGRKWEYGWFRAHVCLKKAAEGKKIYLFPETGGESLVWINDQISCAVDREHHGILLTNCGKAGDSYTVVIESYAGHGPRLENGGPYPPERIAVPEPSEYQTAVGTLGYGIWDTDAFELAMDAFTLYKLYQALDTRSLRAQKIREGLKEFTKIVDFELPREDRKIAYKSARKVLRPLLTCVNGSTMPQYTVFGQSHLDLAWKWPWEETRRKCGRTLSTQLALSDEYPEYKFMICEPAILESVKKDYPKLFERIKKKVESVQFLPEGGMWVEPDTNIPSGESLIRQCIWGKRWFKEEMNYDTRMVWLPDCFGFCGQLPQIMIGTGMKYFTSQKIGRAMEGHDVFPYNIFMWEGIDGTRILTHFFYKNNSRYDPMLLINRWYQDRVQQENIDTFLFSFGFGDGGGGPTREMLEIVRRTGNLEGVPRTKMQSPIAFFEDLEQKEITKCRYAGEIYLAWHRGTYTVQAKTKQGNRKAEIALRELEFWGAFAGQYPFLQLKRLWERLLFNQFHDIIAGTSITRVHEEAERDFEKIIEEAQNLCQKALVGIIKSFSCPKKKKDGLCIFNSLSWERFALVKLPMSMRGAMDYRRKPLRVQRVGESCYARLLVPACGFTTIYPFTADGGEEKKSLPLHDARMEAAGDGCSEEEGQEVTIVKLAGSKLRMQNEFLAIEIDNMGQIISIYDKEAGIEYTDGICNRMCMYQDINVDYDAWEIANYFDEMQIPLTSFAEVDIVTCGDLFGIVRVRRKLLQSEMIQEIIMTKGSRRVDFKTIIDWKETHKLLKTAFPVQVHSEEGIEEIQFGYVKRPTHKNRAYDADRFEVCNHRYTALTEQNRCFAILNDCKYGVSTQINEISLSLLRAPLIPDMYADKGRQEFVYSFYADHCNFYESKIIKQGYELNIPVSIAKGEAEEKSLFEISDHSIILETVKLAEDESDDLILRLYETINSHCDCVFKVNIPIKQAAQTNMLEDIQNIKLLSRSEKGGVKMKLSFHPFEIKTLRLVRF
jgi:alpha-mannosidase